MTASILTLIETTKQVVCYVRDVTNAPKQAQTLLAELCTLCGLLYCLHDLASQPHLSETWGLTLQCLAEPDGALDRFRVTLDILSQKVKPRTGLRRSAQTLLWPFKQHEIQTALATVERLKTVFIIALQNEER